MRSGNEFDDDIAFGFSRFNLDLSKDSILLVCEWLTLPIRCTADNIFILRYYTHYVAFYKYCRRTITICAGFPTFTCQAIPPCWSLIPYCYRPSGTILTQWVPKSGYHFSLYYCWLHPLYLHFPIHIFLQTLEGLGGTRNRIWRVLRMKYYYLQKWELLCKTEAVMTTDALDLYGDEFA